MASEKVMRSIIVLTFAASVCASAPIEVGSGQNNAGVYIEFGDGFVVDFLVNFETPSTSGLELLDTIEAETTLTTVRNDYGWGVFIDGISYEGHSNIGYQGDENWWHYWVNNGQGWVSPAYGAADRTAYDGYSDGWIYGRAGQPIPEPATVVLLSTAFLLLCRRSNFGR